jgi:superfamily II DNA or RNA helicase
MITSGITQEEIIAWGGSEIFNQALALCNSGDVADAEYDDDALRISGHIRLGGDYLMPVSFDLLADYRIKSNCPCEKNTRYGQICPHVVALGIKIMCDEMAMIENAAANVAPTSQEAQAEDATNYIEVPIKPRFFAKLMGGRASLSILVNAKYADNIIFPACSLQPSHAVWLEDPEDPLIRRTRSIESERDGMKKLERWGFEPGYTKSDVRYYISDPQRVLNFLGSGLPELRRAGWRIELSDALMDLTDSMPSVVPVVTIKDAGAGNFDVRYTFDAMGREISPTEIQAAVNRGDGYLMSNGTVVLIDTAGIDALQDVFRDCATTQNGAQPGWFRVNSVYAAYIKSSLDGIDAIDLDDSNAKYWRKICERLTGGGAGNADAKYEPVSLGHLDNVLRPYQKQGVYWMRFLENAGHSGLLADEMGLGKTLQTLAWISLQRCDPRAHNEAGRNLPALIVCPTSLVRNWEAEAKKFTPHLNALVISGHDRSKNFKQIPKADIVITSYALLQRDLEEAYLNVEFSVVVIDEAQHIKNRQTKNAIAVKALNSVQRLALTGTPIENSVTDVWSIFNFLMCDYLGDYEIFKMTFENRILDGFDSEATFARLKRKISPFIMRRLKKTVAKDLPDKITKISYCPMSDEAQREYSAALTKTRHAAGGLIKAKGFTKSKFEILAMLMKLRQIASRAKLEPFMEQLISAVEGGHKILVFSQFVKMLTILKEKLNDAGIPFCYLDGSTKDRLGECNKFNHSPEIPVFLISLMAGGTGLNLTGADMVIHYDPWWNPAVEDQATDRAHRIGQKKSVYVMKMIASGSIEEKVLALQLRKQAVINATVDTTDAAVMETLTAADLKELLGADV